ncbi:MAG: hypothetical protein NZ898_06385 [Myxococcota bacterium]|nr:hypothetical protein [Myxococcota bacterium]MDW8362651.1 hypothetical protein [Myxococcales bacterium]
MAGPMTCSPPCGPGEECVMGACRCGTGPACGTGRACCSGTCVDTSSDPRNCGGCGNTCNLGIGPVPGTADGCRGGRCTCGSSQACMGLACFCMSGACEGLACLPPFP